MRTLGKMLLSSQGGREWDIRWQAPHVDDLLEEREGSRDGCL
jgi:hypothetical protein